MGCYFGLINETKKHRVSYYWKTYAPTIKELKRIAIIFGWNLAKHRIITGGGCERYRFSHSKNKWIDISIDPETGKCDNSDASTNEDELTASDEESSDESTTENEISESIKTIVYKVNYDYESSEEEPEKKEESDEEDYEEKLEKVIKKMKKMKWTTKRINEMTNIGYNPKHDVLGKQNIKKNIEKYKLIFDPTWFWN